MLTQLFSSGFKTVLQAAIGSWRLNRYISLLIVFSFLALLVSLSGLSLDHRLISGEIAWVKPLKFSVSLLLYGTSLLFISRYLSGHEALLRYTSRAALVGSVVEVSAIVLQVLRGSPSHFNLATPLDAALWFVIKTAIMPVAFAIVAMLFMLMRQKNLPPVLGASLRWGAFLTVVGFIPGFMMLLPESLQHIFTNHVMLGHNVGHSFATIPLTGWNAIGGDLRVAHFVGLHALQILPLVGYLVTQLFTSLSILRQRLLIGVSGVAYFALIVLLTWQALRGESIAIPSAATLNFYFAIVVSTVTSALFVVLPIKYAEIASAIFGERAPATTR
jgi:hypothetical protein